MPEHIDSSGSIGGPERHETEGIVEVAAELCRDGRYHEAYDVLEKAAIDMDFDHSPAVSSRFRSYYGLTLAMAHGEISRGERLCREALTQAAGDPEMNHNLGMVYLRCRRRDLAFGVFRQALLLSPQFPATNRAIDKLGRRREPLFTFLPRSHPLNRYAGKLMYRMRRAWGTLSQRASERAA